MGSRAKYTPYQLVVPAWLLTALLVLFPIVYTICISFTNWSVYHWKNYSFVGVSNYLRSLTSLTERGFLFALLSTIIWTVINLVVQLVIAFALALLLNVKGLKLRGLYKTILILPWAMPPYISALVWRNGMFHGDFGLINQILRRFGARGLDWLNDSTLAFVACLLVNLWLALPFLTLIISGGLQSIDNTLYETASVEGAGFLTRTMKITLPLIGPILSPAVILTAFLTFKQFDIFFLMTMQVGNRTGAGNQTVLTYLYEEVFITSNYGYGAAASSLVFLILVVFTLASGRIVRSRGEYGR